MPKRYPDESTWNVVAFAQRGDLTIQEVAMDFGVAEETVPRWLRQADINDGIKDGIDLTPAG
jgi:transposase